MDYRSNAHLIAVLQVTRNNR